MRAKNKKAAPLVQSERGQVIDQHAYGNMMAPPAQLCCAPMPNHGATTGQRAVQLRLFALDGARAEPYVPARAKGNVAATSAAAEEGRAQ